MDYQSLCFTSFPLNKSEFNPHEERSMWRSTTRMHRTAFDKDNEWEV